MDKNKHRQKVKINIVGMARQTCLGPVGLLRRLLLVGCDEGHAIVSYERHATFVVALREFL